MFEDEESLSVLWQVSERASLHYPALERLDKKRLACILIRRDTVNAEF